jgi:N-dimethylarginine dimethylaminohydrolase
MPKLAKDSLKTTALTEMSSLTHGADVAAGSENESKKRATRRVFVESEFAPLRTVVLTQSEFGGGIFAGDDSSGNKESDRVLRDKKSTGPPQVDQARWAAEREAFGEVLEKHEVEILRPRLFTAAEKEAGRDTGYANFFVRDPWFTVGNIVIEGSIRFFHRRMEALPCRDIFENRVYPADCVYVAAPQPAITGETKDSNEFPMLKLDQSPGPFIEGGDVLVWGKRLYVGNSGMASSSLGIEWLRKVVSHFGYSVEEVRLNPSILHLDCAIGMVKEGLMIVCEDALIDGIPKSLSDWTQIAATESEASRLGINGFPINPSAYVTDPEFRSIGDQIERYGVEVEYVDFSISRSFGGAFRCSTQPLWRE